MSEKVFKSNKELEKAIDSYFSLNEESPTITGLALHLGFCSRQSFYDYEKNDIHSYTIKRARLRVEESYEKRMHGNSNAGAIFALKNFGWKDKNETAHTGPEGGPIVIERVIVDKNTDKDS